MKDGASAGCHIRRVRRPSPISKPAPGSCLESVPSDAACLSELLSAFVRQVRQFVGICDADGRLLFVNPAGRLLVGLEQSDLIGLTIPDLVHPDDRALVREVALPTAMRDGSWEGELRLRHLGNGAVFPVEWDAFALPGTDGRLLGAAAFPLDAGQRSLCNGRPHASTVAGDAGARTYVVACDGPSRAALSSQLRTAGYEVQVFSTAEAFLEVAPALVPGCVVVDGAGPDAGGFAIPSDVRQWRLDLPVVLIGTSDGDPRRGVKAMKAGAADFLEKPCDPEELLSAVTAALGSRRETAESDRRCDRARMRVAALTMREREVLEGLVAGGTNKSIARDLGLSPRTVELHRARAMGVIGARTLPEAVLIGAAAGIRLPDL